eukprot:3275326-Pyramimonas_sp.AAC.1
MHSRSTPAQLKRRIREARAIGPVPPKIEALRERAFDALKHIAELVEDPLFALLGDYTLEPMSLADEEIPSCSLSL